MNCVYAILLLLAVLFCAVKFSARAQAVPGTVRMIDIALEPMIDLNFKSKKDVIALRKQYVQKHAELLNGPYEPSEAVFGQLEDFKSWWGILGVCYYGAGAKIIEGPAKESRFIVNPFLLFGLNDVAAHAIHDPGLVPKPIYPRPLSLQWSSDGTMGTVRYDVSGYARDAAEYRYQNLNELMFITYNARDLGFQFCQIDMDNSKNIALKNPVQGEIIRLRHYLHCGGSSGYPGGSNNMSPGTPELEFIFKTLPARAFIKLWKNMPPGPRQNADMVFIVDME